MISQSEPPPAVIQPADLGRPSFQDDFATLDIGTDQSRPGRPHKWRSVLGAGGPFAVSNRSFGGDVVFVDPEFTGVSTDGRPGPRALNLQPFSTSPEGLTITARRMDPDNASFVWNKGWYSGVLTTKFSYAQRSGYWETVANLPLCTKGAWPAIWLLPVVGAWPRGGEIDIMESVGKGKLFHTVHSGTQPQAAYSWTPSAACDRQFHAYGVLVQKATIAFYFDHQLVSQTTRPPDIKEPLYILLDLAMGGAWAGPPEPELTSETMIVKSVRAWDF